jgi:four helix bundle protein
MRTANVHSFRDLEIWQLAMELTLAIYRLTLEFPREEIFGLTAQLRRAAISIPSNIAEGQERLNTREFRQFLAVARAACFAVQTQLEIARALRFGDPMLLDHAEDLSCRVGKMAFKLLSVLKSELPNH